MVTIILADDHQLVRQGIRALLERQPDFNVVAETDNGLSVLTLVEQLNPDILLTDLGMQGLNGLEVTKRVSQTGQTRVIVLSMHNDESYVVRALMNGASGYILKESSSTDVIQAIYTVQGGGYYLSPPLANRAIESYLKMAQDFGTQPINTLTQREREVFQLVAEGFTSVEIGQTLVISPRTVEVHKANLMKKLNLKTQNQVVNFAIRHGVIPPPTELRKL
jgi:two-component system, NarL family, response regulator NreC